MTKLIVALDYADPLNASAFVRRLCMTASPHKDKAPWFKLGGEIIFSRWFYQVVDTIHECHGNLMLDAKLAETPRTTRAAVRTIMRDIKPDFITVREYAALAREAALEFAGSRTDRPHILHVPALSSHAGTPDIIVDRADGVVCRPSQVEAYIPYYPTIVAVGLRPSADKSRYHTSDDHQETALRAPLAHFAVVGRPITQDAFQILAYHAMQKQLNGVE